MDKEKIQKCMMALQMAMDLMDEMMGEEESDPMEDKKMKVKKVMEASDNEDY